MSAKIDDLIINSPYQEPTQYWEYVAETQQFERREGRRRAGYWRATARSARNYNDPGEFIEIALVNQIRPRVKKWREEGYPNITGTTKKLLEYWLNSEEREYPLFWCQLEAVETAIFLVEATPDRKAGIEIPKDGSEWERQCFKLATGTGKTVVMAMLIAWQTLNKLANPQDPRFSKNILIVAPGLTVRDRLQVLKPEKEDNFYQQFNLVPPTLWQELLQAKIIVENWHSLAPMSENFGPKVVKKGLESDEAFVRRTLPDFGTAKNILIINDEAHHCHRPSPDEEAAEKEKATIWIGAIDRIHRARGVLSAYDFTATPFKPTGKNIQGEYLFSWIVSDFGLNDSIESGLVKTPKVAVRDDASLSKDFKSKLFHIYPEIREDINRRAEPHEGLPDLLQNAINILGADWLKDKEEWQKAERETPPVMIVICNRTETAARVEYSIKNGFIAVKELSDKEGLLRIDQEALDKIEAGEGEELGKSKQQLIQGIRDRVNTVGKVRKPGEKIQCVIGVNMLSEGWDARTVTHILGARAFTSQLLCEQVVGRGLRRVSYDVDGETGLFAPEYVTVFGIPFTYLPAEQKEGPPRVEMPKVKIAPIPERRELEIKWPHVLRVDRKLSYYLEFDWGKLKKLILSPEDTPTIVEVAPILDGRPDVTKLTEVDLRKLADVDRLQTLKLQAAVRLREQFAQNWPGDPGSQIGQLVELIDKFLDSDKLEVKVPKYENTDLLRRIVIALNIQKIVNHIGNFIRSSNKEGLTAIFDSVRPVRSTATAFSWYTSKPAQPVKKSQISHAVLDSRWESVGFEFERNRIPGLVAWAKNDHLGFEIYYFWQGRTHVYYPDFILKFEGNRHLILEVKGKKIDQDEAKWASAREWVEAVNADGNFGTWKFAVIRRPSELFDFLK